MAKQDDYVRYTVRIPADLYERVRKSAGDKSVNAEIISRLEKSLDEVSARDEPNRFKAEMEALTKEATDRIIKRLDDMISKTRSGLDG